MFALENATELGKQSKFYVDGFELCQYIEHQTNWLNTSQQCKTAYVCRTHLYSPNAVAFSSFSDVPFDPPGVCYVCTFFHCMLLGTNKLYTNIQ